MGLFTAQYHKLATTLPAINRKTGKIYRTEKHQGTLQAMTNYIIFPVDKHLFFPLPVLLDQPVIYFVFILIKFNTVTGRKVNVLVGRKFSIKALNYFLTSRYFIDKPECTMCNWTILILLMVYNQSLDIQKTIVQQPFWSFQNGTDDATWTPRILQLNTLQIHSIKLAYILWYQNWRTFS